MRRVIDGPMAVLTVERNLLANRCWTCSYEEGGLCLRLLDARGGAPVAGTLTVASRTPITRANVEIRIVVPEAYVIHAQTPDGSKIVMEISPDQIQAVIERTGSSSQPSGSTTRKSRPFETHSASRSGERHREVARRATIRNSARRPASPSFTEFYPV